MRILLKKVTNDDYMTMNLEMLPDECIFVCA